MGRLGYCNQTYDSRRGIEGEANQATECVHILPWTYSDISGHEDCRGNKLEADGAGFLYADL
jgi:hypothetical protein